MAASISIKSQNHDVWGRLRARVGTVTFDASYETGGEAITPGQFSLAEILAVIAVARPTAVGIGKDVAYLPSTGKLIVSAGAAEVAAATDLSTVVCDVIVLGI